VVRNRARRLLRDVYRHHQLDFVGFDAVVNVKPGAVMTRAGFEQELLQLVQRARRRFAASDPNR
jgi:ribonuclease P protein component